MMLRRPWSTLRRNKKNKTDAASLSTASTGQTEESLSVAGSSNESMNASSTSWLHPSSPPSCLHESSIGNDDLDDVSVSPSSARSQSSFGSSHNSNDSAAPSLALSQRLFIQSSDTVWSVMNKRPPRKVLYQLTFSDESDDILVTDGEGNLVAVVAPSLEAGWDDDDAMKMRMPDFDASSCVSGQSSSSRGHHQTRWEEYSIYTVEPSYPHQRPTPDRQMYFHARIQGKEDRSNPFLFQFSCHVSTGHCLLLPSVSAQTLSSRAFCMHQLNDDGSQQTAARVTCVPKASLESGYSYDSQQREVLVYPTIDPMVVTAFVAVVEEMILVRNL